MREEELGVGSPFELVAPLVVELWCTRTLRKIFDYCVFSLVTYCGAFSLHDRRTRSNIANSVDHRRNS